jgi:N-acetylated-alpha-linked acidic dipeptidase
MRQVIVGLLAATFFISSSSAVRSEQTVDPHANVDALVGWPSGPRVVAERRWEDRFIAVPSAENALDIEHHISAVPHRAGTPADYKTALYVRDRLRADGFSAELQPFEVLFTEPTDQKLELVEPEHFAFDLLEGEPGHHSAAEVMAGPSFMENSGDGDATGALFYLNHGTKEDWDAFDDLGVAMPPGSIVLERWGGFSRDPAAADRNYRELVAHKVAGVLQYADPQDDGYVGGEMWPKGNFKNANMAERIGGPKPGIGALAPPGDPTLPGQAPLPGVKHLAWEATDHATIPEMDVTQAVARKLLAGMSGPVVPEGWHGGFEMVEHVGGNQKVRLAVTMSRRIVTIWNVIGTLRGATKPGEVVLVGGHRDAMAFGAIDPGSGTTVMLQMADAFKKLGDAGWKPDRTISIASWDGHELGLWGSMSLAYWKGPELRKSVVQYINTDQLETGPPFIESMSPELWAFGREIAGYVKGVDGKPLAAAESPKKPLMFPPGGGSDHMTFIYWLGIPSSTTGYYGHFGAHHTAEDNIEGLATYDPGMHEAVIMAQFDGVQAMRAAGAERMPLRLTDVVEQLQKSVAEARRAPQYEGVDFTPFAAKLSAYHNAAVAFDAKLRTAERSGDKAQVDALETQAMTARDVFWMPEGLTYNKYWHTIDRLVSPFPELNYAAFATKDRDAALKIAFDRLSAAVDRAIAALT